MFAKFTRLCTEIGPLNAVYWSLNRLFGLLRLPCMIYSYNFMAQPVSKTHYLPEGRRHGIVVRPVAPDDAVLKDLNLDDTVLRYRSDQNAICFGAFKDGVIIGSLWLCLSTYDEDEVRCRYRLYPEGRTAWDFDVFVSPSARGGFAFLTLWDAANAYLRERNVSWSLSRISVFNPTSLYAHQRLGARRIAGASFFRLGPAQLMVSSIRPWLHLSLSADRMPTLALSVSALDRADLSVNPPLIFGQL